MESEEKDIGLFDDYYFDRLSEEDKSDVEKRLQTEPDFKSMYEDYLMTLSAITYHNRKELVDEMKREGRQITMVQVFRIAAMVLIALSVGIVYFVTRKTDVNYMTAYYEKDTNITLPIARGETDEQAAYDLYLDGKLDEAGSILDGTTETPYSLYLSGLVALEQMDFEEAERNLRKALENPSGNEDHIRWYLAIALLEQDKLDDAKEFLEAIVSEPYKIQAQQLLRQLP